MLGSTGKVYAFGDAAKYGELPRVPPRVSDRPFAGSWGGAPPADPITSVALS